MAARTTRQEVFTIRDITCMVSYKRMKNIRWRVASGCMEGNVFDFSFPDHYSSDMARRFVADNYFQIAAFGRKTVESSRSVARPGEHGTEVWLETLRRVLREERERMGVPPLHVSVRMMKSRWGSCVPSRHSVTFNLALASLPEICTRYVVVHELSHLFHPDHSVSFWAHVEAYFPDYRRVRAFLRSYRL